MQISLAVVSMEQLYLAPRCWYFWRQVYSLIDATLSLNIPARLPAVVTSNSLKWIRGLTSNSYITVGI